jgi:hypothetical protein
MSVSPLIGFFDKGREAMAFCASVLGMLTDTYGTRLMISVPQSAT